MVCVQWSMNFVDNCGRLVGDSTIPVALHRFHSMKMCTQLYWNNSSLQVQFLDYDLVAGPYHQGGAHWTSMVSFNYAYHWPVYPLLSFESV